MVDGVAIRVVLRPLVGETIAAHIVVICGGEGCDEKTNEWVTHFNKSGCWNYQGITLTYHKPSRCIDVPH